MNRASFLLTLPILVLPLAGVPGAADASVPSTPANAEAQADRPPELYVDERTHHIGEVPFGQEIPVHFELENRGSSTVVVEEVVAPRGLSPALEVRGFTREIPPGEGGGIDLVLDTSKMVGPVRAPFHVLLQGAEEPMILAVAAKVRNYFAASPGSARWLYVQGETTGALTQHVWAQGGEEFEVLEVHAPPGIDAEFRRAGPDEVMEDKPQPQWLITASVGPDIEVGPISGVLEVVTDHSAQQRVLIPVSGFVRPAFLMRPEEGSFGSIAIEEPRRGLFHLKVFTEKPVEIEAVEVVPSNEKVEAGFEVLEPGREFQIWVKLLPGMAPGPYEGELRIHTDSEILPVVRAPVEAVVRGPEAAAD